MTIDRNSDEWRDLQYQISRLYDYQREGVKFGALKPRKINGDDMGLGKTAQTILSMRINPKPIEIVVAISPSVWVDEFRNWWPSRKITVIEGSGADRRLQLLYFTRAVKAGTAHPIVMSYSTFRIHAAEIVELKSKNARITFDEAHTLRNRTSLVSKAAMKVAKKNRDLHINLLSGTILMNTAEDLWPLLVMVDPETYTSFWNWADTRLSKSTVRYGARKIESFGAPLDPEALAGELRPYLLRRLKSEVLNLPPKTYQTIRTELSEDQRRVYNEIKKQWYTLFQNDHEISVTIPVTEILRLKQICVSTDLINPNSKTELRGSKIDELDAIIEGAGDQKVVVFSQFAVAIRRLSLKYATTSSGFTGDDEESARAIAVQKFQSDESIRTFFVTYQAGYSSITLTRGSIVVLLDKVWNPKTIQQAIDRVDRISQTRPVTVIDLQANTTLESWINEKLDFKTALADSVVDEDQLALEYIRSYLG